MASGSGRLDNPEGARMTKRNVKGSVYKLNILAKQVAGKPVPAALTQLKFSKKRRANAVARTIETACNMADIYHGLQPEELFVSQAIVGRGSFMKRPFPRGRGKMDLKRKTMSHLTIVVQQDTRPLSKRQQRRRARVKEDVSDAV